MTSEVLTLAERIAARLEKNAAEEQYTWFNFVNWARELHAIDPADMTADQKRRYAFVRRVLDDAQKDGEAQDAKNAAEEARRHAPGGDDFDR